MGNGRKLLWVILAGMLVAAPQKAVAGELPGNLDIITDNTGNETGELPGTTPEEENPDVGEPTEEGNLGWYTNPETNELFYYNEDGLVVTGLRSIDGCEYFFSDEGVAQKGWVTIDKYCYYFEPDTYAMKVAEDGKKFIMVDGYKVDKKGRSKTRYDVVKLVNKCTTEDMTKKEKIRAIWKWMIGNKWTYTRTNEHIAKDWKWYEGWTDDFAAQLMKNKSGNCFRYAALYGYMVKEATGYDVRVYHGYTGGASGGLVPHGWVTVKISGKWYAFDPDLQKFNAKKEVKKYYYQLYSKTKKTIHKKGKYTALQ